MLKLSSKTCTNFQHDISGRNPLNGGIIWNFLPSWMCFLLYSFQGCLLTGCLNGGSCVNDERKQNYLCLCTKGWTGEKCETKIGKKRYYQLVKVSVSSTFQILTILSLSLSFCFQSKQKVGTLIMLLIPVRTSGTLGILKETGNTGSTPRTMETLWKYTVTWQLTEVRCRWNK